MNMLELSIMSLAMIHHNSIINLSIYFKSFNYSKFLPLTKRRDGKEVNASCRVKSPEVT